ncbi:MAG TPA: VWA domain-containing protein [Thermoanaerobaculia bacterium]|jgi:VWFA-related protein|nr:VWA domain-containing protein [Thermoanaerobaculia bacterium]
MYRRSFPLLVFFFVFIVFAPLLALAQAPPPKVSNIADLPPRYQKWLEDVALLISPKEKAVFLGLGKDYQRDAFIRKFWQVRDPFPQTPQNELEERWEKRVEIARARFGGVADDRAHMLLFNGEPAEVLPVRCEVLMPLEIWTYSSSERVRGSFTLVFIAHGAANYQLWYPNDGLSPLLSAGLRVPVDSPARAYQAIGELCPRGDDIASRLAEALDWKRVESSQKLVPKPGEEWLSTFSSFSTDVPAGASTFPARVDLSFPGRTGSRTVVQALVSVPRDAIQPERIEGSPTATYVFTVDGEVLHKEELFEHFRYRFALPEAEVTAATIPLVFQRFLRPGSYSLVLKIEDTAGRHYFREERELEVPVVTAAEPAPVAAAPAAHPPANTAPAPAAANPAAALDEANATLATTPNTGADDLSSIRILPPPAGLITGKARVEAIAAGSNIAKVTFELDGKPVLTKGRPPYSVELNLGAQPRLHVLRALALDGTGKRLAEDQVELNAGPHRFAIRLVEPQPGKTYNASLSAQAQVDVPEGEKLDRVELFLNDNRVATLYQPPFTQPILLPQRKDVTWVRAVAYLDDGNSTESTVLVNAPGVTGQVDVQFVQLFTSVVDGRGHPVEGLKKEDFTVLEDGVRQQVRRFELVKDVPIYAGILLDTSASMSEAGKLDEAVKGALRFFQKVITPKDRASVITFSDQPNLAVRFTNDESVLAGGLAGLKADGNTTLYDSIIYSLYYFGGIKGKRAIILLSDGKDEGSHYSFNDALEYARRSGVSIYTVGIELSTQEADVRLKLSRLADETGGRVFFISKANEVERIYDIIQNELRSQYLLAYQSSKEKEPGPEKFRTVEVKMSRPGLEAKTLRGYYP